MGKPKTGSTKPVTKKSSAAKPRGGKGGLKRLTPNYVKENPRWRVNVQIVQKRELSRCSTGDWFDMQIKDKMGNYMRATAFGDAATKLSKTFKKRKWYWISGGTIKEKNEKFKNVKFNKGTVNFELNMTEFTKVTIPKKPAGAKAKAVSSTSTAGATSGASTSGTSTATNTSDTIRLSPTKSSANSTETNPDDVSDKELISLSRNLGPDWLQLGSLLGFSMVTLDHIKMTLSNYPADQWIYNMLVKWKEQEKDNKRQKLAEALQFLKLNDLAQQFTLPCNATTSGTIRGANGRDTKRKVTSMAMGDSVKTDAQASNASGAATNPEQINARTSGQEEPMDIGVDIDFFYGDVAVCTRELYNKMKKKSYDMCKRPRGTAVIMNLKEFPGTSYGTRQGTDVDRDRLKGLWEKLHFKVKIYNDEDGLTAQGIRDKLCAFSISDEHAAAQCAVICILSHGEPGGVIVGSDGRFVYLDQVKKYFDNQRCPRLRNKPKLWFIQACRGGRQDYGVEFELDSIDSRPVTRQLQPSDSDFLFAFATQAGFVAHRNERYGSIFVKAVVEVFLKHAHEEDLCAMLNAVNGLVSRKIHHPRDDPPSCQISTFESSLQKFHLFFFPGIFD